MRFMEIFSKVVWSQSKAIRSSSYCPSYGGVRFIEIHIPLSRAFLESYSNLMTLQINTNQKWSLHWNKFKPDLSEPWIFDFWISIFFLISNWELVTFINLCRYLKKGLSILLDYSCTNSSNTPQTFRSNFPE